MKRRPDSSTWRARRQHCDIVRPPDLRRRTGSSKLELNSAPALVERAPRPRDRRWESVLTRTNMARRRCILDARHPAASLRRRAEQSLQAASNRSARRSSEALKGSQLSTSRRSASVSRWPCCRGRRAERSYRSILSPSSCSSSIRRRSWRRFSASSSRPRAESIRARSPFEATAGRSPWPRGSRTAARRRSS